MSLGYEFAPIDVNIITHPKVADIDVKDRAGAFGLWCWGQCYARLHARDGHLKRSAVLSALALPPHTILKLAAALVLCGLWVEREDLSWDIYNFMVKSAGDPGSSAERMRRLRAKRRGDVGDVTCDASLPSPGDVTTVTRCSYSPSSSSGSRISDPDLESTGGADPPDWWQGVLDTLATSVEAISDPAAAWLRYRGHRAGKAIAMTPRDAEYWLTTVIIGEQKNERQRAREREDGRRFRVEPPKPPEQTAAQRKAFAEELSRRVNNAVPKAKVGT